MNDTLTAFMMVESSGNPKSESLDWRAFFAPESVAVIGASPKPGNLGKNIVQSLLKHLYGGTIITVHPKGKTVAGCPAVTEISDLPDGVDLAIAAVPATQVLPLLEPLAHNGVHHLIIISGGFAETGEAGEVLQNQIRDNAKRLGIRIIGPNGMGVFSAADRFNSFFLKPGEITLPKPGPVALISQSGAFLMQTLSRLGSLGVGVHRAVNFGNRIDVGECELLEEFGRDPNVRVIGLYLESVQDGSRLVRIAREVTRIKPVIVFKGGHGDQAGRAAQAHSASLAGSYSIFKAACEQTGMIEVNGLEHMIDAIQTLTLQPPARDNRILIVSNGGGMGVFLTDLCEQAGLRVPEPAVEDQESLKAWLPDYFSLRNPIDLTSTGTNSQCLAVTEQLLSTGNYDALLMVLLPGMEGIHSEIAPMLKARLPKNIPVVIGAYGTLFEELSSTLTSTDVPVYPTGERAARSLALLVRHSRELKEQLSVVKKQRTRFDASPTLHWLRSVDRNPHEMEVKNLLSLCNISVPQHILVNSEEDVNWAIEYIGFPLALKVVGPDIQHKTELEGIKLDLNDKKSLLREWQALARDWPGQVWTEHQMPPGLDLMVGAHRDAQFGPVLLFGTGGSYVELYQDIARWVIPATDEEIIRGIQRTKAWKIIKGFRGKPPLDQHKLLAFLQWVADWMISESDIVSMDFNPVRLYEKGLVVLDAKITRSPL